MVFGGIEDDCLQLNEEFEEPEPGHRHISRRYGLIARGGFQIDIDRENGLLKQSKVISKPGNPLNLSYRGKTYSIPVTEKGKLYLIKLDNF